MSDQIRSIINEVANRKDFISLCRKIASQSQLGEDLFHEIILKLYNPELEPKILHAKENGYLDRFLVRSIFNEWNSRYSQFNKKYGRGIHVIDYDALDMEHESESDYDDEHDHHQQKKIDLCNASLEQLYWYEAQLTKLYLKEGKSYRGLSRKTGIHHASIYKTVNKAFKKIKEKVS